MTAAMTPAGQSVRVRRGITLIELIITLVLVAIIGAAAGSLLLSQTRFYARMSAKKDARQVTRNAINILQTELSMVEAPGGVVEATNDSITVRMPYAWGVMCASNTIVKLPVDSALYAMATFAGYAIKDTTATGAFTYTESTSPPTTGTSTNCTNAPVSITAPTDGSYLAVSGIGGTAGAPVLLWQLITYKFAGSSIFPGQRGLYRRVGTATAEEILAPFGAAAGFRFYNLYADTAQATVPSLSNIRGVELWLPAQSQRRVSGRSAHETVTIKTAIFFRNRVD